MLSLYEKETVNNFVNNDENKLVFFNMKNIELCKNISNVHEQVIALMIEYMMLLQKII